MDPIKQAEKIWLEHQKYIRKFCEYKLKSAPDLIDDCMQEVFLALLRSLMDSKQIDYPKAYLTKVALNKINDIYKAEEKNKTNTVPFEENSVTETVEFELPVSDEEIDKYAEEILTSLTDSERKLIEDFYVKKIKQKHIASELNISENTLRQQIFRLKHKIIKEIKKFTS